MKYLLILTVCFMPTILKASEVYIDHVTIKGRQFIVIEKNKVVVKIEVLPGDDIDTQVRKVCVVIGCRG